MINKLINRYLRRTDIQRDLLKLCKYLRINQTNGDYLEFGVFEGKSLVNAHKMSRQAGYGFNNYIGYDTFEGIPNPKGVDKGFIFKGGEFKTRLEKVNHNLRRVPNLKLIKGEFKLTLDCYTVDNPIAMVYVDCDYYESTKLVLDYIQPHLREGMVIVFADWYIYQSNDNKGERKAFREFRETYKQWDFEEITTSDLIKAFIVKKK